MNVPRTIAHLRDAAVSAGLTNLFYGVDEGRILSSAKGADKGGAQLPLRIVGDTFQAAYDARIAKQIFDSGAEYFASWGYLSGPDTFFEGFPSVSFHVARESARFKGMRRLSVTVSGAARTGTEADAVAAQQARKVAERSLSDARAELSQENARLREAQGQLARTTDAVTLTRMQADRLS